MIHLRFIVLLLWLTLTLPLAGLCQVTFEQRIPWIPENWASDVIQTQDSGFVICGKHGENYYQWPFWKLTLTRTDKLGTVLWKKEYSHSIDNAGYSVRETSDGGLVACGVSQYEGYRGFLLKTDADGDTIFSRLFKVNELATWAYEVRQYPDQGYLLCGCLMDSNWFCSFLLRTDSQGNLMWEKAFSNGHHEWGNTLTLLPDGDILLVSGTESGTVIREVDPDGELIHETFLSFLVGVDMKQTADQGFILVGNLVSETGIGLLKLSPEIDSLWATSYLYNATATSVITTSDGGFLTGATLYDSPLHGLRQLWLLRLDPSGSLLWTRRFGGSSIDMAGSVSGTFDQGYVFTGTTSNYPVDTVKVILIKGVDDSTVTALSQRSGSTLPLRIWTNHSSGTIYLDFGAEVFSGEIEIFTSSGRRCLRQGFTSGSQTTSLQLPGLLPGLYIIRVITQSKLYTGKFIL